MCDQFVKLGDDFRDECVGAVSVQARVFMAEATKLLFHLLHVILLPAQIS